MSSSQVPNVPAERATWPSLVLRVLAEHGTEPVRLNVLYAELEQLPEVRERVGRNTNWKARVRQVCQALHDRGVLEHGVPGVWYLRQKPDNVS